MRKPANYEETQAYTGESRQLPAGLYVCQIVMAIEEERNGSRILAVAFDIAEGEYKGFYKQRYDANTDENKKWPAIHRQFVEDRDGSCNPFFKGLITSIEESNPNFKWNWEESTLKGKKFGAIMGREEFLTNDGQKKMATKVFYIRRRAEKCESSRGQIIAGQYGRLSRYEQQYAASGSNADRCRCTI